MDVLGQERREGLGKKAESRISLAALGVVSALLLLSSLYSADASVFRRARETVVDAAAPILEFLSAPIAFINRVAGDVDDYFNVLKQNQALREENAELRQWMNEALALRETISAYEGLQSYYTPPDARPIDAFVIGESNDAFAQSMLVNVGAEVGVKRGQAVVDERGLVGRIVAAGSKASRILLLTDAQSRIPVYVEGADLEGILVGRTRGRPAITFTESSAAPRFEVGNRVLTSAAGGVLPRGIPVGLIAGQRKGEAIVQLFSEYSRTRMVRIINYEFPALEEPVAESSELSAPQQAVSSSAAAGTETTNQPAADGPPAGPVSGRPTRAREGGTAPAAALAPPAAEDPNEENSAPFIEPWPPMPGAEAELPAPAREPDPAPMEAPTDPDEDALTGPDEPAAD